MLTQFVFSRVAGVGHCTYCTCIQIHQHDRAHRKMIQWHKNPIKVRIFALACVVLLAISFVV